MKRPAAAALPRVVVAGTIPLAGRIDGFAFAPLPGELAAGDDRGAAGVWRANGAQRAFFRLRGPVACADIDAEGARAMFGGPDGDVLVGPRTGPGRRLLLAPGERILFERTGPGFLVVAAATGTVVALDADGRPSGSVALGAPLRAAVAVPGQGGLTVLTSGGEVLRVSVRGEVAWRAAVGASAASLAVDPAGETVAVCLGAGGVALLGSAEGDVRRRVATPHRAACAALSSRWLVVGCGGRWVRVLGPACEPVAEGRVPAPPREVAVAESGAIFARLGDGTVRRLAIADPAPGSETPARRRPPRRAARSRRRRRVG